MCDEVPPRCAAAFVVVLPLLVDPRPSCHPVVDAVDVEGDPGAGVNPCPRGEAQPPVVARVVAAGEGGGVVGGKGGGEEGAVTELGRAAVSYS